MKCKCCSKSEKWNAKNIGSQKGKNAIATGANSGVGFYDSTLMEEQ